MIITRNKYNQLNSEINNLRRELEKERKENSQLYKSYTRIRDVKLEEILNDYKYAILVDNVYQVRLYNEGRYESVKAISFESDVYHTPAIEIRK